MSNRYPSTCNRCSTYVPARAGTLHRVNSRWHVICPDCTAGAADEPNEALEWSRGNSESYGAVTSSGWRGMRNRRGRCEDAPCCGCCTF